MKTYIKLILIAVMVSIFGFFLRPDDKELFMGSSAASALVKPNIMIVMDSSSSMNTVIFYPGKGLDGKVDTADDGYKPNVTYSGNVDSVVGLYTDLTVKDTLLLNTPTWVARWITAAGVANQYEQPLANQYWTGCYATDGTGKNFQVGSNEANFSVGERVMYRNTAVAPFSPAVAKIKKKYISGGQPWFELEDIQGGPILANATYTKAYFQRRPGETAVIVKLWGGRDAWGSDAQCQYEDARYPVNYLKWMFIHATDDMRKGITHFCTYASFNTASTIPAGFKTKMVEGQSIGTIDSYCDKGNHTNLTQLWTRIQVGREVMCWLARYQSKNMWMGLMAFEAPPNLKFCPNFDNDRANDVTFDPAGGNLIDGLGDNSELASLVDYISKVYLVKANSRGALAETLLDTWDYYKPGPSDGKDYWPVDILLANGTLSTANAVSYIKYWCQNNYVILMTGGSTSYDDFTNTKYDGSMFRSSSYPVRRNPDTLEDQVWTKGWGDTDNYDPLPANYNPGTATYCPNYTCWSPTVKGTDYLDDMAYFMRFQDLYPDRPAPDNAPYFSDDPLTGWPGNQKIYTYVIGFNADNNLLQQTAINGDGGYYTADNYEELTQAFQNAITSINLRNFAFSSITAPKKTATATNDEVTLSYIGYFMPSASTSVWEGHMLANPLIDLWGFDVDGNGEVGPEESVYETEEDCYNNRTSDDQVCTRWLTLSLSQVWDAADHMPENRNLWTHNNSTLIEFAGSNSAALNPLFGGLPADSDGDGAADYAPALQIIDKIRTPQLGDIFHSDLAFVGPPPYGKQFIANLAPPDPEDQTFAEFYEANKDRRRVVYAGTNDGILHMFYADKLEGGDELWGFIPDEVLPSLKNIVLNNTHTYTVDGRITPDDIYYDKDGDGKNEWSTIAVFGLRQGGRSFYCLDVTEVGTQPSLLWKFNDTTHSGYSWGKPVIGRVKIDDPDDPGTIIPKWVVILPGGYEFNRDTPQLPNTPNDLRGKAIFVLDAATGELLWMIGYKKPNGAAAVYDSGGVIPFTDDMTDDRRHLTTVAEFNYPIPSSMTVIDRDGNGFLDTIYFGNLGGHLFKTDISAVDPAGWETKILFKDYIPKNGPYTLSTKTSETQFTLSAKPTFALGAHIMGQTSFATAYVTAIAVKDITVTVINGSFVQGESIISRTYDPIFLSPSVAYDKCYQLFLCFGTGDRDRPRTNLDKGRFICFKDNDATFPHTIEDNSGTISPTLQQLTWTLVSGQYKLANTTITNTNGWYFNFPNTSEKMFDPEPIILPDLQINPHIYFDTYQPPPSKITNKDNPCDMPPEGTMTLYDLKLTCGANESIEGTSDTGRIAGGGVYEGKEYILYLTKSKEVAGVPDENIYTEAKSFGDIGGLVFWKEKKR